MRTHLEDKDKAGLSTCNLPLRLLGTHFENLQAFGVPTGTVYSMYLRALRELISVIQGTERIFKPTDDVVI